MALSACFGGLCLIICSQSELVDCTWPSAGARQCTKSTCRAHC
jgi:hypothetical protein